jgi:hypothetical protein
MKKIEGRRKGETMTPIKPVKITTKGDLRHKCVGLAVMAFGLGFSCGVLFALQRPTTVPLVEPVKKAPAAIILVLNHLCKDFGGLATFQQLSSKRFAASCRELAEFPRVDFTEELMKKEG